MMIVVSYDVSTKTASGRKRLNRVAKTCQDFGIRAQNSVFECVVEPADWETLKDKLLNLYDPEEDSLRFYHLGSNWRRRVEKFGKDKNFDFDDTLIL